MERIKGLENRLKEILYRCLEEIRATKAALYLENEEKPDSYSLVTSYGFKQGLPESHEVREDLVSNLIVKRSAFFVNELTEDPRFSELLYEADTTRLLVAPIYSRGRLVGLLDLRDKAAQETFTHKDVQKIQGIADSYLELFAQEGLFGQKKIEVAEEESEPAEQEAPAVGGDGVAIEAVAPGESMPGIVDRASSAIARGALNVRAAATEVRPLSIAGDFLPMFLGLPGLVMVGVTEMDSGAVSQKIACAGDIDQGALDEFHRRLATWFERREKELPQVEPVIEICFNGTHPPVTGDRVTSLMSAAFGSAPEVVLSLVFENSPTDETLREMESFLKRIDGAIGNAIGAASHGPALENVAARLIEPDLRALPDLFEHSRRVASLARDLARSAGLPEAEARKIWLAGLVHDVGSRPLGWERLQRRGHLTDFELKVVRQHPVVGAAMVARSALGSEIARIVYSHHERIDGKGYPTGISSDEIPLGSRIIHICEAFDAMTAEHSYKEPISRKEAVARIRDSAGTQFDAKLVEKFAPLVL